ncbi:hypothetical protein BCR39DRAFT_552533 [Naematelia encephala]|uniref:Uncharacterized protein n=1 Tax=Naematelia encephala TaxID=71784 RepID=A0A1Y2AH99_9TREE|nr:hypothetical protein BCR39DRAFT_552533 [Naematelia encephala]
MVVPKDNRVHTTMPYHSKLILSDTSRPWFTPDRIPLSTRPVNNTFTMTTSRQELSDDTTVGENEDEVNVDAILEQTWNSDIRGVSAPEDDGDDYEVVRRTVPYHSANKDCLGFDEPLYTVDTTPLVELDLDLGLPTHSSLPDNSSSSDFQHHRQWPSQVNPIALAMLPQPDTSLTLRKPIETSLGDHHKTAPTERHQGKGSKAVTMTSSERNQRLLAIYKRWIRSARRLSTLYLSGNVAAWDLHTVKVWDETVNAVHRLREHRRSGDLRSFHNRNSQAFRLDCCLGWYRVYEGLFVQGRSELPETRQAMMGLGELIQCVDQAKDLGVQWDVDSWRGKNGCLDVRQRYRRE